MLYSRMLISTTKEKPANTLVPSHALSIASGMIYSVGAGLYAYSPLGKKVLDKTIEAIKRGMGATNASEVSLPILQPYALHDQSGRAKVHSKEMFKVVGEDGQRFFLAPSNEEVAITLIKRHLKTHKQLPITIYQVGRFFRDERASYGTLSSKEFWIYDGYSFCRDGGQVEEVYARTQKAFIDTFSEMGIEFTVTSFGNTNGSSNSVVFMVLLPFGRNKVLNCTNCETSFNVGQLEKGESTCPKCNGALEQLAGFRIGDITKLGTDYSSSLGLTFIDSDNSSKPVEVVGYGVSVSRLLAIIIEQNHDEKGIIWPLSVAPFHVAIIPINYSNAAVKYASDTIYQTLNSQGMEVILDDRGTSPGVAFRDADLIGFPYKLIVSQKTLKNGSVEIEPRKDGSTVTVDIDSAGAYLKRILR